MILLSCKNHIFTIVPQIIERVGENRFSAACSDNAGNVSSARRKNTAKHPWIFGLQDADHTLSLTLKEIADLEEFSGVVDSAISSLLKPEDIDESQGFMNVTVVNKEVRG